MSAAANEFDLLTPQSRRRSNFFSAIAIAMLVLNLVGFGPTLYLRPLFDVPPIPAYLYVHGVAGTAWFVLLVVQTRLIARGRAAIHRRLGWAMVAVAALVLLSGIYTSASMVPRNVALGLTSEADMQLYVNVTAADNAAFITFPTLVLLGAFWRARRDIHKRLMLLASLAIIGPAAARIGSWYGPIPNPIVVGLILALLAAMIAHDVWTRRRPHAATLLGALFMVIVGAGIRIAGVGETLVEQRLQSIQTDDAAAR